MSNKVDNDVEMTFLTIMFITSTQAAPPKVAPAPAPKKQAAPVVVTSIQSSAEVAAPATSGAAGPRQAGARRSRERARGTRKPATGDSKSDKTE